MASFAGLLIASSSTLAQSNVPPSYGHDFVTVGAPGNRPALPSERVINFNLTPVTEQIGAVNYTYRISRTETTIGQWLDFVRVAWPVYQNEVRGNILSGAFTGSGIGVLNWTTNPTFFLVREASVTQPTNMEWRAAAMYCNWLHNGRPTGPGAEWSVRSGAYDIRTFTRNPDLSFNDQLRRSEGARYWIPDLNEWTKAAHYDPNRYGPGQEGYWKYPVTSDTAPLTGPPGQGTTGGTAANGLPLPVGSYPDVQSPWGLLDASGGYSEWTETVMFSWQNQYGLVSDNSRIIRGSNAGAGSFRDEIDAFPASAGATGGLTGLRIASLVSSPAAAPLLFFALCVCERRVRSR